MHWAIRASFSLYKLLLYCRPLTATQQINGVIKFIRNDNMYYPACPLPFNGKQCNKKMVDTSGQGTGWYCERCGTNAEPEYR